MGAEQDRLREAMRRLEADAGADAETVKHLNEYLGYYLGEGCEEELPGLVTEVGKRMWDFYRYLRTCGLVIRELTYAGEDLERAAGAEVGGG